MFVRLFPLYYTIYFIAAAAAKAGTGATGAVNSKLSSVKKGCRVCKLDCPLYSILFYLYPLKKSHHGVAGRLISSKKNEFCSQTELKCFDHERTVELGQSACYLFCLCKTKKMLSSFFLRGL